MKKSIILLTTLLLSAAAMAQMAIPGAAFADNPTRFNGRKVTVKGVSFDFNSSTNGANIVSPMGGPVGAPTAAPGPSSNTVVRCNPPRGFSEVKINFHSAPSFKACFFMADPMLTQLERESSAPVVEAEITFRGDLRVGYNVTFYRLKF